MVLPSWPLTSNGKIDRRALPEPEYVPRGKQENASRSPMEEILEGIWCDVLKLDRVDMEESFFNLGGHSLLGTHLVSAFVPPWEWKSHWRGFSRILQVRTADPARDGAPAGRGAESTTLDGTATRRAHAAVLCAAKALVPGPIASR